MDVITPKAVEITEIRDPALVVASVEFLDQDIVKLQSTNSLKARRVMVRLEGGVLIYHTTNLRMRARPTLLEDYLGYLAFGPYAAGTANGLEISDRMMLAVPAATGLTLVAEPGYESISLLFRPEDVSAHLGIRDHQAGFRLPVELEVLKVEAGMAGNLFALGKRLVDAAAFQPELFDDSKALRLAAKADLLDALLTTLSSTQKLEPARKDRTRQAQSAIVRAAEQYAMDHADERLYVTDLCQAASVSERTLEYAFRSVMELSPTAYLTRIRLHKVRQALLRAEPGATTVTAEALNWGFWHFGEFSKAYKDCFEELPSDTLKRPRD